MTCLLEHVVGEAEARLERGGLKRWLRLERQVSAIYPTVDGMASPLIGVSLRAGHEWHRRSAWRRASGVAVGVRAGDASLVTRGGGG